MKINFNFYIVSVFILLLSCESENNNENIIKDEIKFNDVSDFEKKQILDISISLPSPMEASVMLKDANAIYMADLLNPVENEVNYSNSSYIQALNLGVYGADLGYACAYTNVQDAFSYLRVSRSIAESLGILGAFETKMIERFDKNLKNRDSIMTIVGESFQLTDKFLKENDRANVSVLVVAGGWIEGLYLTTKIVDKYPSNMNEEERSKILSPIIQNIADQKTSLYNLTTLLEKYKENKNMGALLKKLDDLKAAYSKVEIKEGTTNINEETEGITTFESESEVIITPQDLGKITLIVNNIRKSITEGSSL